MIIVTGATGFVGRYLVDHLVKSGETVAACGRTRKYDKFFKDLGVTLIPLDVTEPDSFKQLPRKADGFIHLAAAIPAAVKNHDSDIYLKTNTLGTLNALNYCQQSGINKFLYTTTRFECAEHTQFPITEAMGRKFSLIGDHANYVIAEIAASDYVEHFSQQYGMQGIIFRLTGLLGVGRYEQLNGHKCAFETFYENAKSGKPIEVWGTHQARRDTLYVKDAARAIYAAIRSDKARGIYSISSGEGRTTDDEAKIFAEVFGTEVVYRPEKPEKNENYHFDIGRAKRDFGWQPIYKYADILRDYDAEIKAGRFAATGLTGLSGLFQMAKETQGRGYNRGLNTASRHTASLPRRPRHVGADRGGGGSQTECQSGWQFRIRRYLWRLAIGREGAHANRNQRNVASILGRQPATGRRTVEAGTKFAVGCP